MKIVKLLLIFSIMGAATGVTAQEKAAEKLNVIVEGKIASVEVLKKQLGALRAELEKATAKADAHAEQLKAKELVLVEYEEQITAAKRQATLAEQQAAKAKKAAQQSLMRADKALAEAEHAKVSQELGIGQYKALLQLVEQKQGPEHAYSQRLKAELMDLEAELAVLSQQFGPMHPKVQQVKDKAKVLESQLHKASPQVKSVTGRATELKKRSAVELKAVEKALSHAHQLNLRADPAAAEKLRTQIADATMKAQLSALNESRKAAEQTRALYEKQFASRRELAEQESAVAMQLQRTQEMLEMQKRLLSAEKVAEKAVVTGRLIKLDKTEEHFDRLEQKLDKIGALLEKLIDKID